MDESEAEELTIRIRPIEAQDFSLVESWLTNPPIWKYLGPPFYGGKFKRPAIALAVRSGRARIYITEVCGTPVGVVGLSDVCETNRRANCWYALGETAYANKGVMKRSCQLIVEEAFSSIGLHSLSAWAIENNVSSIRILKASGFVQFGLQHEAFMFEGRLVDVVWFEQINTKSEGNT